MDTPGHNYISYIAQKTFLTALCAKLDARRQDFETLNLEMPKDLNLHCDSCSHALDTINARKMANPKLLFDIFVKWDQHYFPTNGIDTAQANEARSLYKQGNGIEYLADLYDLPVEYIVEYVHTNPQ